MKRYLSVLLICLASACPDKGCFEDPPSGPTTIQDVKVNVTVNSSPSPSPSASPTAPPAGFCESTPISFNRFGIRDGATCEREADRGCAVASLRVGSVVTFDITPFDSRTGQPATCHPTLSLWLNGVLVDASAPPATTGTCSVSWGGATDFLPRVRGLATGECNLRAGVGSGFGDIAIKVF